MTHVFNFERRPSRAERTQNRIGHFVASAFAIPVSAGNFEECRSRGDDDAADVMRLFRRRVSAMLGHEEVECR
ncbi:hypothetical protein BH09MYX1_BH09MYX1_63380 [soil metagenome]